MYLFLIYDVFDDLLVDVVKVSDVVIFILYFEGFGFFLVEVLLMKKLVIVLDILIFWEIVGDILLFFCVGDDLVFVDVVMLFECDFLFW